MCTQLDDHQKDRESEGYTVIKELSRAMINHYEYLKESTGLKKEIEEPPENTKSNDIFATLRPSSPYKLTQLLSDRFNPKDMLPGSIACKQKLHSKWIISTLMILKRHTYMIDLS